MILALEAPTDKAAELMDELGISIYDAHGNMVPIIEIIGRFSGALSGLTQEQRNAALAAIFGSDAVRAANIVLMGGVEAYQSLEEQVNHTGAAAELAGARMEGLGGAFESLQSAAETAMLAAVEPFKEDIEGMARSIAEAVNSFSELDTETQKTIVAFLAVAAGIGPATYAIGLFARGASTAITLLSGLPAVITSVTTAFRAYQAGLTLTTALQAGFGALPVTLGAIALAVASVVGVWIAWNENIVKTNEEGKKAVDNTWKQFFDELVASGADAEEVMDAYLAAQERVNQELQKSGVIADIFVDQQGMAKNTLAELSPVLAKTGSSYEEYIEQMIDAGIASGLLHESYRQNAADWRENGPALDYLTKQLGLMTEAQVNGVQAAEDWNSAEREAMVATNAIAASANDAAEGLEATADAAQEVAEAVPAALDGLIEGKDILSIFNEAMQNAAWDTQRMGAAQQTLSILLGETSSAEAQARNDTQLIADAYAAGIIPLDQFNQYMLEAKDGTLALGEATRGYYSDLVAQNQAQRDAAEAAQGAALAYSSLSEQLKGAGMADIARAQIQGLNSALQEGKITPQEYGTAVQEIQLAFGLADEKSLALAGAIPILTEAFIGGKIPASDFDLVLKDLNTDAADGTVDMEGLLQKFGGVPGAVTPMISGLDAGKVKMDETAQAAILASEQVQQAFIDKDWHAIGFGLSAGLAQGILDGIPRIVAAAKKAAEAASQAVQEETEVESPSKKWMYFGEMMDEGLAVGVENNLDAPILATQRAMEELTIFARSLVSTPRIRASQTSETPAVATGAGGPIILQFATGAFAGTDERSTRRNARIVAAEIQRIQRRK